MSRIQKFKVYLSDGKNVAVVFVEDSYQLDRLETLLDGKGVTIRTASDRINKNRRKETDG